ncbi:MAG: hypothetical protein ABSH49_24550 [Bryobacteraceae bacterium]|jgi:hypothetical protein
MEKATFHEEEFSFRLTHLSPESATHLRTSLSNVEIQSRRADIVALVLREDTDLEPLYKFLKSEGLDPSTYSVWVSVVSSSDHDGVSLPKYILEVIRSTQCGVDFSFVGCLGDPVEDERDPSVISGTVPN